MNLMNFFLNGAIKVEKNFFLFRHKSHRGVKIFAVLFARKTSYKKSKIGNSLNFFLLALQ